MISSPRYINRAVSNYLRTQIESGDPFRTRRTLQEISSLYRKGFRFLPDQLFAVENAIVGLTFSSENAKVRRWALNALAQLGDWSRCERAIRHALATYHAEAETLAAAIAALFRLCRTASDELRKMGFDEQTVTLAALQHVPPEKLDLSSMPLRIENAGIELVKLGLIVVGLDRAPPHLFEPEYDNGQIVRALGRHQDPVVSQYSVWAITENPHLGIHDLDPDLLRGIEGLPPNVRAWVYQLLAADWANARAHADYIRLGITDGSVEARMGLAIGLKESFDVSYVEPVLDWLTREVDGEVRQQIIDHLIRHANRSEAYKEHALDAFERGGSDARARMLATAAGLPLFSQLSAIKYQLSDGLFGRGAVVNNNTVNWNIQGGVQGGAVALGGNAENSGGSNVSYNVQTLKVIQDRLADAMREIGNAPVDAAEKEGALAAIEDAKREPTKDKLARAVSAMDRVESLAKKALGVGTAIAGIARLVMQAAGLG